MSNSTGDSPFSFSHTDDGICVSFRGRTLYNPRSPRSSARQRINAFQIEPDTLYIVASPLLGYGLETLAEKLPDSSTAVGVEFEPKLSTVSQTEHPKGIRVLTGHTSVAEASRSIAPFIRANIRRVRLIPLSGGYRFASEQYDSLLRLLTAEIALHWRNAATRVHFGRKWVRNMLRNVSVPVVPDAGSLSGHSVSQEPLGVDAPPGAQDHSGIDCPIVVCGAGESLEWNLETIHGHRSYVYVVAVDTALGTLREAGIEPDGVIALESQVVNTGDFLAGLPPESTLYYDLTVHPSIPWLAEPDRRRPFMTQFADLSLLERVARTVPLAAIIPPFSSVGVTAVHLSCLLTTHPVFITGLDFAYILGKPHARGALSHRLELATHSRLRVPLLYDHTVFRPRTREPRQFESGKSYESESTLLQQITLLSHAVEPGAHVYTLPRRGPDTPIPEISREQFEVLLEQDRDQSGAMQHTHGEDRVCEPCNRAGLELLEAEYGRLGALLDNGPLKGLEYLFFDFPDAASSELNYHKDGASLATLDTNLARKITLRAESYLRYIHRLLQHAS